MTANNQEKRGGVIQRKRSNDLSKWACAEYKVYSSHRSINQDLKYRGIGEKMHPGIARIIKELEREREERLWTTVSIPVPLVHPVKKLRRKVMEKIVRIKLPKIERLYTCFKPMFSSWEHEMRFDREVRFMNVEA